MLRFDILLGCNLTWLGKRSISRLDLHLPVAFVVVTSDREVIEGAISACNHVAQRIPLQENPSFTTGESSWAPASDKFINYVSDLSRRVE